MLCNLVADDSSPVEATSSAQFRTIDTRPTDPLSGILTHSRLNDSSLSAAHKERTARQVVNKHRTKSVSLNA